jgi:4-carboxymuconolactone decarboxylase
MGRRCSAEATPAPSERELIVTAPPRPASAGRDIVRTVAPKLIELTEQVVYGDVWERPGLSKRDRSLITVAALIALERREQLPVHLERALGNGVTIEEIGEMITHLAFYAGWPAAMSAGLLAAPYARVPDGDGGAATATPAEPEDQP